MLEGAAGEPPLTVSLRRSARARRFSLRVSRLDGRITLTIPTRAREAEAVAFAQEKSAWLRRVLAEMGHEPGGEGTGQRLPVFGEPVSFEGRQLLLQPAPLRSPRIEGDALLLPEDPERMPARLGVFLKHAARDRLSAASDRYAAQVGRRYSRLTLRDTRSRWGSCTHDGGLMYSWRLIMTPPEILNYVAAHEVAHLVEMNHSSAFWSVVERLDPGYAEHRLWLRREGAGLHRLRFA